jgi:hypothetical protein
MSIDQPHRYSSDGPSRPAASIGAPGAVDTSSPAVMRCQWCSVPLKPGVVLCPTCGSPGIPDPRLSAPEPEPLDVQMVSSVMESDIIAPWRSDDDVAISTASSSGSRAQMTFQEAERRQVRSIVFVAGSVLVCAVLGWLAGPLFLTGVIESFTGTPVENPDDLRPMGAFFGLTSGFLIGGIGGVVIWSDR